MTQTDGDLQVGASIRSTVETRIVADVDVVVAGGGTAGVVAAIAAARNGASVFLVERRGYLGGMMTGGNAGLCTYLVNEEDSDDYHEVLDAMSSDPGSVRIVGGIPLEMTRRLIDKGVGLGTDGEAGSYVFTAAEEFKLELLEMMEEAGVQLLLHSLLVDVISEAGRVRAVVIENKNGRQAILAKTFVDATGDGDLAARAGVPFAVGVSASDLSAQHAVPIGSLQNMGVMFRIGNMDMARCLEFLREHPEHFKVQPHGQMDYDEVCRNYAKGDMTVFYVKGLAGTQPGRTGDNRTIQFYNTPYPGVFTCCCPTARGNGLKAEDLTSAEITLARTVHNWIREMRENIPGCENIYLLDRPEIGVRETRHCHGEYLLTAEDLFSRREFEDTIGRGSHHMDVTPLPKHLLDAKFVKGRWYFNIPYRSLVAREVDNVLLAGRCISCTHEVSGCVRSTVQCMVTGQAAGTAAAMCAAEGTAARDLDAATLRRTLSDQGVVL